MSLVDMIEMLGAAVDDGHMTADEAARRLVEFSEGGLTLHGARNSLRRHRTIRADRVRSVNDTRALLAALTAMRDARTPEEKARARLAFDVEVTLQRAADRERLKHRLLTGGFPSSNGDQQ